MKSLKLRISALAIMIAIGAIGVTFTSCQKDVQLVNNEHKEELANYEYLSSSSTNFDNLSISEFGQFHNLYLDELNNSQIESNGLELMTNVFNNMFIYEQNEINEYCITNSFSEFYSILNDNSLSTILDEQYTNILPTLNSDDQTKLQEIKDLLDTDYGQNINQLRVDFNALMASYTGNSDLINGILSIGDNSIDFWANYSGPVGDIDIMPIAPLIAQADAAGYLIGWSKAYFFDEIEKPNDRIKKGAAGAYAASGGLLLKKWFKF